MLPRLSRKLFTDLALWMLGFGFLMGFIFPYFMLSLGFAKDQVLSFGFYSATLIAGILVAIINYTLARLIIGSRLAMQTQGMRTVAAQVRKLAFDESRQLDVEGLHLPEDSADNMGEMARSFNELVETLARSYQVGQDVSQFTRMAASHLEVKGLARQSLDLMLEQTGSLAGAIFTVRDGQPELMAAKGIRDADPLSMNDHLRDALRQNSVQRIEYPQGIELQGVLTEFRPREVMLMPVSFKGVSEGLVVLASQYPYAADMEGILELYRPGLGMALKNAMSHDRLQRLAVLDPLTNVYNRRFGMGRLHEEFSRAVRDNSAISVLMLDIDNFKDLNDTYGHMTGDKVILNVVQAVKSNLREGDTLVRYGGEEFMVILPGASLEDGRLIGERIRRTIMDTILQEGGQNIGQTVSLGIAACPDSRVDGEDDLIRLADAALYSAKANGKNQLIAA
jgi:diguanylate cyclase (GGDEF)-like protein